MKTSRLIKQAEEFLINGDYEVAKDILTDLLDKDTHNPEIYYLLADTLCKLRRFEDAITLLRKANRLAPKNPQIIHLLGWALFMNSETDAGRMLMEKALKIDPNNEQIYSDLAVLEMKNGNLDRARFYINQGEKIVPNDSLLHDVKTILDNLIFLSKQSYKKDNTQVN